ncbi:MAG: hypothetical protein ACHQTE_02875 [Candidatus Saccharimonadales bacterium]
MNYKMRMAGNTRRALYVTVYGVTALVIIGIVLALPLNGWLRLLCFCIIMAVVAVVGYKLINRYLPRIIIPPHPTTPPSERIIDTPQTSADESQEDDAEEIDDPDDDETDLQDEHAIALSAFARRRIAKEWPGLEDGSVILEKRKTAWILFLQLEKRVPTGRTIRKGWRGKRKVVEMTERSTIIREAFFLLLAVAFLFAMIWAGTLSTTPPTPVPSWIIVLLGVVVVLFAGGVFYKKWAYWFFWRVVEFHANPEMGFDAKVVIIDKPFLLPGGSVPGLDLRVIELVSSSTAENQNDEKSWRSITAGWLRVAWLALDTQAQQDQRFNWMGPFRSAPSLVVRTEQARRRARLDE